MSVPLVTTRSWGIGRMVAEPPSPYARFSDEDRAAIRSQLDWLMEASDVHP